ncbi:MAG: hypothetical protein HKO71_02725, partial [Pseudomonadales bacterium]|nr:hypothetical protein [Pseudomonadales bacterium]
MATTVLAFPQNTQAVQTPATFASSSCDYPSRGTAGRQLERLGMLALFLLGSAVLNAGDASLNYTIAPTPLTPDASKTQMLL